MTCTELHEQITAYVDDRVDEAEYRAKMQSHINSCPACRAAFEAELLTKTVVRAQGLRTPAPAAPPRSAIAGAGSEGAPAGSASAGKRPDAAAGVSPSFMDRIAPAFTRPAGVMGAILVIAVAAYSLMRPSETSVDLTTEGQPVVTPKGPERPQHFTDKAVSNFQAIVDHKLALGRATGDRDELESYFKEQGVAYNVDYGVVRATLAGGVVSQNRSSHFAHLVYTIGDNIIYLLQAPKAAVQRGDALYLPADALAQLNQGKVVWDEPYGGTLRLVVFTKGDLVCAVVSNAARSRLEPVLAVK
ncbi:MAG TPA: zf-HC2 domain-containing protein [Candidatus Kapabacteria bacterium]|nr:zf-HC2 domain-containing protein [Candidatus Kapabacteria bacterium]